MTLASRKLCLAALCGSLFGSAMLPASAAEVILQYFGTSWPEITRRLPELAEAGYTALWLPPPYKAGAGTYSVGFDTYDRFDLGGKYQMSTTRTKYGTETELQHLIQMAHRFGLRVYFDNVMAHNGGPMPTGAPGTLSSIGFVPQDFHLIRTSETTYKTPDWPTWSDEWQVLNRNPFGQDIAQENPNTSFGWSEGDDIAKWSGVRHPGNPEYYVDTDLPITYTNGATVFSLHTFANKEPFQDIGYTNSSSTYVTNARWNARFDWQDLNSNGQHDSGEPSEPFTDTGIDPSRSERQVAAWGYGDGKYNMGNPSSEDVNSLLYRAVRWFVDRFKPDGFRLDAVKHVPAYFFGKMDAPKDDSDWGYGGQIQIQFNISRGFSDWNNHRDTVFDNVQPRDDAMLYGEHLGEPPSKMSYVDAGMRVANDDFLNAIKGNVGSSLSGMDNSYYALISPGQSMLYVMSHDNNYLWDGDRQQAHALLLTREGLPIVYTDGYNESGSPDWFPKPSKVPFLGQFAQSWVPNLLDINRHFGWGYQASRWSTWDYLSYTRYDESIGNNGQGVAMVFALSKNYLGSWPLMTGGAVFPEGARLFNYSMFNPGKKVKVLGGNIVDFSSGEQIYIAPNEYYAYSWRIPDMPLVWGNHLTNAVRPITILQNGQPVGSVTCLRQDGRNGDPAFNPYALPDAITTDHTYAITLPRVTSATGLTFLARADGSAENILMKLDGGMDLNAQMSHVTQAPGTRDNPPAVSKDKILGYEQMQYVRRVAEKFAAQDVSRNIIGSLGAETYRCTIGSSGFTVVNGSGDNTSASTATWVFHNPSNEHYQASTTQMIPLPQSASGQSIQLWLKVGYQNQANKAFVYYTTDGSNPEGSAGQGKGSTQVAEAYWQVNGEADGTGTPDWWMATLPAQSSGVVLTYKVATHLLNAASRFPWSDDDIAVLPRMETLFEITNFNAAAALYFPHNDWGEMATGLAEGFHILRTKAFLGRASGDTPIYRENTQTFYLDAQRPQGRFLFPSSEVSVLADSTYKVIVRSDPSVEEAWYTIEDGEASNNDSVTGLQNGNGAWVLANAGTLGRPDDGAAPEKQWEFDYVNIPSNGAATLRVVLRELTSSTNYTLLDESAAHFTRLERTVATGSSGVRLYITEPSGDGRTLGMGSNLIARFSQSLATGLNDSNLLACFAFSIDAEPAVLQTQTISRSISADEHQITCMLPNFYDGNPATLHTLQLAFSRTNYEALQAQRQAYAVPNEDSNNDGIPDAWELHWELPAQSLSPTNDYDDDGVSDYLEYLGNTDPTDEQAYFGVLEASITTGTTFNLRFPASLNRDYYVWYTESLFPQLSWTKVNETPMPGDGQIRDYSVTEEGQTQRFYKVQATFPEE